jgi:hypothetical protein
MINKDMLPPNPYQTQQVTNEDSSTSKSKGFDKPLSEPAPSLTKSNLLDKPPQNKVAHTRATLISQKPKTIIMKKLKLC